jgi:glycerol-3-phosphate cytidylyltransferase-like family protein
MKNKQKPTDEKMTKEERTEFLKKMLNVSEVKVGKTWRKKYETSKSTKRSRD